MNKNKFPKKGYCDPCKDYVPYEIKEEKRSVTVKGITFEATEYIPYCKNCGEELWINEVERINDISIYDKYREIVGLLTSKQIKEIRQKRNMSQVELATFLSIGEKDIARYENGSIQSKAIDNMIRMVGDDTGFIAMNKVIHVNAPILKPLKNN